MTVTDVFTTNPKNHALLGRSEGWTDQATSLVNTWFARSQKRREYEQLLRSSDKILEDIGVSRGKLWREINKPFWVA